MKGLVCRTLLFLSVLTAVVAFSCGGAQQDSHVEQPTSNALSAEEEANAYMSQGGMALSEGDTEGAIANYLEAARIYDQTGRVIVERAEAHFLVGDLAHQLGDDDLSLEHYDAAAKIYVRFTGNSKAKAANALANMGVIYKTLEEPDKARTVWESALEIYKSLPVEFQNRTNMAKIQQNIYDLKQGF